MVRMRSPVRIWIAAPAQTPRSGNASGRFSLCKVLCAGKVNVFLKVRRDAPLGQRQGGVFRLPLPTSGLHPPRNATTATAASGGNREQLLGQRPARRECRPRHEADAGCRNPSPRAARPFQTPRQKSKRKNASRFAKSIFRASPIDRPLSRCGGSSPQGSGGEPAPKQKPAAVSQSEKTAAGMGGLYRYAVRLRSPPRCRSSSI